MAPKPQPFEEAAEAFDCGRNQECVAALHHHVSHKAAMLRARAYIRLSNLDDAYGSLRAGEPSWSRGSAREFGEHHALLGTVLDRLGYESERNDAFDHARSYVARSACAPLQAELAFYEAQAAWRSRDIPNTERRANEALAEQPHSSASHAVPLASWRALHCELLALVAGTREHPEEQIAFLHAGIDELGALDHRDVWIEATLLRNIAAVIPSVHVLNVGKQRVGNLLRTRAESLPWSVETHDWAYQVYRSLGWANALEGNYVGAFRDLRAAEGFASSNAWRIESILDRGYLFGAIGEATAARERFDEAQRICKQVDWENTDGEDRSALLWGAELAASFDPNLAESMAKKYRAVPKPMNPVLAAGGKTELRRWQAFELDAYGTVSAATGKREKGLAQLRDALRIWDSLRFEWRAAKTAATIARITGSESDLNAARRRGEPFAASWLARPI